MMVATGMDGFEVFLDFVVSVIFCVCTQKNTMNSELEVFTLTLSWNTFPLYNQIPYYKYTVGRV